MAVDRRFVLLLSCFFGSGFAALVYEIAWTRQFAFVFGTSELAVATVLAGYMAGLAAGAGLAGRLAPRIRRPVLAYALLELGIGATALLVPAAIGLARRLYVTTFGAAELVDEGGLLRSLFYLGCSFAILVVPTALMGATLPLLARYAVRSDAQVGPRIGLLYTFNTLGAVCGTVATAFALLSALGLRGSVHVAVAANAAVFLGGLLLARGAAPVEPAATVADAVPRARAPRDLRALILPIMFLSGAASFTYEVLWTRLLGHLLGGSVYAFATMLATFLSGIALGSAIASRLAASPRRAAAAFIWAQAGTAALSVAAFYLVDWMPQLVKTIAGAGGRTLLSDVAVAAMSLLPGTICIGATFPLAVRILAPDERAATAASARVYAWNTVGAVCGAIGAGFFLLPALGFAGTLRLAAAANLALGLCAGVLLAAPRPRVAWAAAAGLIVLAVSGPAPPWSILRSSPLTDEAGGTPVFYRVGQAATVLMLKNRGVWEMRTNGLPEARIQPKGSFELQEPLPLWMGALPSLARPEARNLMVVGLGGGVLLESVPRSVERIDVVEIEPQVVQANLAIASSRAADPLSDPRVHVIINDARDALTLGGRRYDLIASQPSHPWTAAAANLYTREFFALAAEHLEPDGVLAQWMGLAFVDETLLRSLVATLRAVFAHVLVYHPATPGLIFLASNAPFDLTRSAPQALSSDPDGYARLGIGCLEDLEWALVLDAQSAAEFASGAQLITDDRNQLAMRSPAIARSAGEDNWRAVNLALWDHDALRRGPGGLEPDGMVRRLLQQGHLQRAALAAQNSIDPAMRALCQSWIALASNGPEPARKMVAGALALDDTLRPAWLLKLELEDMSGLGASVAGPDRLNVLLDSDRAVIEGWSLRDRDDWRGVQALEPRLAAAGSCDPFWESAMRLRIAWRLAEGNPALGLEAMSLVDLLLARGRMPLDMLLRARAAAAAQEWPGLVTTLYWFVPQAPGQEPVQHIALVALQIINAAAARGAPQAELADLRRRFLSASDPG